MAKRKNRNESRKIEEINTLDSNLVDKLFIAGGVILFIVAFYVLTIYITNKHKDTSDDEEKKVVEISKDKIILGRSLSMSKDDYYVVYYDNGNTTIEEIISGYTGSIPIYKVDMSNAFNKKYATSGESNKNPSKVSEFKINGPTLIKVSNKKVALYIEGEDEIRTILN